MNKLWLDDVRIAPAGWIWAHSVDEAKKLMSSGVRFDEMSLDHDMGLGPPCSECANRGCYQDCKCHCHDNLPTGYDFVKWMGENNLWPPKRPNVHSMNPAGKQNMDEYINRYGPYGGVSTNPTPKTQADIADRQELIDEGKS